MGSNGIHACIIKCRVYNFSKTELDARQCSAASHVPFIVTYLHTDLGAEFFREAGASTVQWISLRDLLRDVQYTMFSTVLEPMKPPISTNFLKCPLWTLPTSTHLNVFQPHFLAAIWAMAPCPERPKATNTSGWGWASQSRNVGPDQCWPLKIHKVVVWNILPQQPCVVDHELSWIIMNYHELSILHDTSIASFFPALANRPQNLCGILLVLFPEFPNQKSLH